MNDISSEHLSLGPGARIRALANKLLSVESSIRMEMRRPRPCEQSIKALKRSRLRIKDEIQALWLTKKARTQRARRIFA